jgi:hypothetical protein
MEKRKTDGVFALIEAFCIPCMQEKEGEGKRRDRTRRREKAVCLILTMLLVRV